ncbi:TetR/AcrR family transcriptional regulator [Nocardia bovistercoris]|uniref:TetR/AcrR family transcriptional regulator n=1 Tax=Nocardia bovistercoris TaxID=2785916 RepID=A0A931N2Q3_9NOCA|nr:TetR/AcrR family transcriptional regulator [Nocardia bovistercoris]MBH0779750.1 TetR/AcrR family transcriptional regulator [Nocardia bovistercoris]
MVRPNAKAGVGEHRAVTGHDEGANVSSGAAARKGTGRAAPAAPSPREIRRRQRIETSREQILDTAEQLFAERGYHDTGLKDVASQCEFSVGSIYSFFDSKDALYEQVLMRRSIAIESIQKLIPDGVPADERLVGLARLQIEHALEHPAWGAVSAEISRMARSRGTDIPEAWLLYQRRVLSYICEVIETGQSDGTLRPGSPIALGRLYFAVVTAFILVTTVAETTDEDGWPTEAQEFLDFVFDTFSVRPRHIDGD